jgi:maltose/moltooligosaccharide transporter
VFLIANLVTVFFSKEYPPENLNEQNIEEKPQSFGKKIASLKNIITDFIHMPQVMRQVSVVQFFTWIGLFCFFLFYSLGVTQNVFGLPANATAENNLNYQTLLEHGAALGGLGFATYTFASFIYAYLLPFISKVITRKGAHIFSLTIGGVSLFATNFMHSGSALFVAMIGLGLAWASIITMPYAILASNLPKNKMGLFMGLLNVTICVPQIIAALTLGFIVEHFFHGHAMSVVSMAGVFFIIAALMTFRVEDKIEA